MKKIITILALCLVMGVSAHAQWTTVGLKLGTGYATYVDNLITESGVWGWSVGGYFEYSFEESSSFILENMSIQTGLNLMRRGYNFEEPFESGLRMTISYGFTHAWYIQLPVLLRFKYELPVRDAGHYVSLHLGPAFSFGLFGNFRERKISPNMPQESMNYDTYVTQPKSERKVFNHIRRPDVNFILGVGYEHNIWAFDIYMDYGFLATSLSPDRVKELEQNNIINNPPAPVEGSNDKPIDPNKIRTTMPEGNNLSIMASVSYRIPLK